MSEQVEVSGISNAVDTPLGVTDGANTEPVEVQTLDPVEPGTPAQTYTVRVGEAEQQVTLEDLQSGFMRQADYTRKTQEVAAMRHRLSQAEAITNSLEKDPESTLRALATAFGVGVGDEDEGFNLPESDPTNQRISAIERQFQSQEQSRVRSQIDSEIETLLDTHGDFDLQSVLQHAAQQGMTVTSAYRDLNFDTAVAKRQQEEAITAQKRDASVVVGGATRTGVTPSSSERGAGSIREAWAMAQKSLGISPSG